MDERIFRLNSLMTDGLADEAARAHRGLVRTDPGERWVCGRAPG